MTATSYRIVRTPLPDQRAVVCIDHEDLCLRVSPHFPTWRQDRAIRKAKRELASIYEASLGAPDQGRCHDSPA